MSRCKTRTITYPLIPHPHLLIPTRRHDPSRIRHERHVFHEIRMFQLCIFFLEPMFTEETLGGFIRRSSPQVSVTVRIRVDFDNVDTSLMHDDLFALADIFFKNFRRSRRDRKRSWNEPCSNGTIAAGAE